MPIRRSLIVLALIAVAAPLITFGALSRQPEAASQAVNITTGNGGSSSSTNLQFHEVARGDVISVVSAVGEIEPESSVSVSFTAGGRIAEIFVKETDYVSEGTPLMRLENDNARIAYEQAVLGLETAEIELADLKAGPDSDDITLARANVEAAEGSYRGALSSASQAEVEAAELQVEQAEAQLDAARDRRLLGGQFDRDEEIDLADAQIGAASFNAEIARQRLQDLQTGDWAGANAARLAVEQAKAELEQVLAGPTDLQIEQAETRVTQAEAQLDRAEASLEDTIIRAPFDGYVAQLDVEPGTLITPGTPVARMVNVEPLSVTVQVDEIDIGQIEPGQSANVEVDALPDALLDAVVARLALVGQPTEGGIVNYEAEIELTETDPAVRVGMTAEANIIVNQETDVVRVPNAFVRRDRRTNEAFVQRLNPETDEFEEVSVSLSLLGEDYSAVSDGLSEGDILRADLTGNQFNLFGG